MIVPGNCYYWYSGHACSQEEFMEQSPSAAAANAKIGKQQRETSAIRKISEVPGAASYRRDLFGSFPVKLLSFFFRIFFRRSDNSIFMMRRGIDRVHF